MQNGNGESGEKMDSTLNLYCSVVFPYKPKMPPKLLMVGEILQELKVLADS